MILEAQVNREKNEATASTAVFSCGESKIKDHAHEKENDRMGGVRNSRVDGQTRVRPHKKLHAVL